MTHPFAILCATLRYITYCTHRDVLPTC